MGTLCGARDRGPLGLRQGEMMQMILNNESILVQGSACYWSLHAGLLHWSKGEKVAAGLAFATAASFGLSILGKLSKESR